jgi:hypothetical protein
VSTLACFGLAAALLVGFVVTEARVAQPLVPLRVLRVRATTGANVIVLLVGAALISMWFFLSLYLQDVLGYSPLRAGLAFVPMSLTIVAMTSVASRLVARAGVLAVLVAGLVLVGAGLAGFTRLPVGGSFTVDFLPPSLLATAGLGLTLVSSTVAAVAGGRPEERGLASGLVNTSRLLGGSLGLAVLSTVASARAANLLAGGAARPAALTGGFHLAFALGAGMCLAGAPLALVLLRGLGRPAAAAPAAEPEERAA